MALPPPLRGPRLGLCCTFAGEPALRFRTTTAAHLARLVSRHSSSDEAFGFYGALINHNLDTLEAVLAWCEAHAVRAFRINSDLWPRATHPLVAPWVATLFASESVQQQCVRIRERARGADIRLSEHPDQFLVGNSLRHDVVTSTIAELEWRGALGAALGVDVICLHVGSGVPDRGQALARWEDTLARLSTKVRTRLAFENDDRAFSPADILPASLAWNIPLVYDAHHHRVLGDSLSVEEATELAVASWGDREPYFHLSSPRAGWDNGDARPHHDMIDVADWPQAWTAMWEAGLSFTVDIEAKAKERAVFALRQSLLAERP
jgi:UV DNA damage endonuclease